MRPVVAQAQGVVHLVKRVSVRIEEEHLIPTEVLQVVVDVDDEGALGGGANLVPRRVSHSILASLRRGAGQRAGAGGKGQSGHLRA